MGLTHSPADILAQVLVDIGQGSSPSNNPLQAWPVYTTGEPNAPDNCITVKDTVGQDDGRTMPDGEPMFHPGFQIRLRATDEATGYAKANAIRTALSQILNRTVTIGSNNYFVNCVVRIGQVLPLGKDTPHTKRSLFTLNAMLVVRAA
jgi:hypothetical protein